MAKGSLQLPKAEKRENGQQASEPKKKKKSRKTKLIMMRLLMLLLLLVIQAKRWSNLIAVNKLRTWELHNNIKKYKKKLSKKIGLKRMCIPKVGHRKMFRNSSHLVGRVVHASSQSASQPATQPVKHYTQQRQQQHQWSNNNLESWSWTTSSYRSFANAMDDDVGVRSCCCCSSPGIIYFIPFILGHLQ